MEEASQDVAQFVRTEAPRIEESEREVDQRDETIRLLNEALSRALDELNRVPKRRAA